MSSMCGATCPDAMDQLHVEVLVRNQDQRMVQKALLFSELCLFQNINC